MYLCVVTTEIFKSQVDNKKQKSSQQIITTPPMELALYFITYNITQRTSFLKQQIHIGMAYTVLTFIKLKLIARTYKGNSIKSNADNSVAITPYGRWFPLKHASDPSK